MYVLLWNVQNFAFGKIKKLYLTQLQTQSNDSIFCYFAMVVLEFYTVNSQNKGKIHFL